MSKMMMMMDRAVAEQALTALELDAYGEPPRHERNVAIDALRAALAEPLTDEQISDLWHQSGQQPFKFARMLLK